MKEFDISDADLNLHLFWGRRMWYFREIFLIQSLKKFPVPYVQNHFFEFIAIKVLSSVQVRECD